MKNFLLLNFIILSLSALGQRGKNGSVTISSPTIVNEYTTLSSSVSSGSSNLIVTDANLNANNRFSANLSSGDLLMIIQMQGASINGSREPWSGTGWYGLPLDNTWGEVVNYNNAGNYEFVEVASVPNTTTINLKCGLQNNYTDTARVQVIRVPRYNDLTVNNTISADPWNGTTGGIVAIEVLGATTINSGGSIDVTGLGFRGGTANVTSYVYGASQWAMMENMRGGEKGESIGGKGLDYDYHGGRYGMGAAANGGGGGNSHNSGGGGGANGGNISNWNGGVGVPNPTYNAAWALETPSIAGAVSSGGGRGGYTINSNNQNALTTPPGDGTWGSDNRQNHGGLGGRPLDYSTGKIFLGGGGGAGHKNDATSIGGSGGNGGGLVYIRSFDAIAGAGSILANGNNGENLTGSSPSASAYTGKDGPGGAGAGGTVIIEAVNGINSVSIEAKGGKGGDQILSAGTFVFTVNEGEGPGGGGGGGYIAYSSGTPSTSVIGGANGTTNSDGLTEFPDNGATSGGTGTSSSNFPTYTITALNDTICSGTSTTLTAVVNGSLPSGAGIIWYDAPVNGNFIGAGTNFTTGNLTNDTTFYVGICPGSYTVPVSVIMGVSFSYSDNNILIQNEDCGSSNGSITGITITGGAVPYTFEWNNIVEPSQDLTGIPSGSYTLVVTDANFCSATIGTYVVGSNAGFIIDTTTSVISPTTCGNSNGSITGISVSGGSTPYSYTWNNVSTLTADTIGLDTGLYVLNISDANGCSDSTFYYQIINLSGPTIDTSALNISPEHCNLSDGAITGITTSGGNGNLNYFWNNQNSAIDITGIPTGNYTLVVIDTNNCTDTISNINVGAVSGPVLDSSNVMVSPESCGNFDGSITGITTSGGTPPYSYLWSNGETTQDLHHGTMNQYSVQVTDSVGCTATLGNWQIGSYGYPNANFSYSGTFTIGDTINFTDLSTSSDANIASYFWNFGNGDVDTIENPYIIFSREGTFVVCLTIENKLGCSDTYCQELVIQEGANGENIGIPTAFSPNGDGSNDVLRVRGSGIKTLKLQVYNRWGEKVFEGSSLNDYWDGTYKGQPENPGVFTYILEYEFNSGTSDRINGNITLVK